MPRSGLGGPMVDLFRFIEHEFALPVTVDVIDLANDSDFQRTLDDAADGDDVEQAAAQLRELASGFLEQNVPSLETDPAAEALATWPATLQSLEDISSATVKSASQAHFGRALGELTASDEFGSLNTLLQNVAVAVKLVTGFDKVDSAKVATQVRAAAFLQHVDNADPPELDRPEVARLLTRPLQVPTAPLAALSAAAQLHGSRPPTPPDGTPPDGGTHDPQTDTTLRTERDLLQSVEDLITRVRPEDLRVLALERGEEMDVSWSEQERGRIGIEGEGAMVFSALRLGDEVVSRFADVELEAVRALGVDVSEQPVVASLERIGQRIEKLNQHLLPLDVATRVPVVQVGAHLVARLPKAPLGLQPLPDEPATASKPVMRPVGYGNLQVVRQELLGYEAGEVSHIENVLPHEAFTRSTERTDLTETIQTDASIRTQHAERDQQSTDRSELAAETQREAGHEASTTGPGMTSSDYGKLVENKKSSYAQTVVARSLDTVTQQVRSQRVARESRTFVERVEHVLDNTGDQPLRGIYQWVDKRYNLRVMNYGRRLLYDVVLPEPAAFLTRALEESAQPENFELVKPLPPAVDPAGLNRSNYQWWAARYGVTGSVSPPPAVFDRTTCMVQDLDGSHTVDAYGTPLQLAQTGATAIRIPEGYRAVRGYVQRVNAAYVGEPGERQLEVFLGESYFVRSRRGEGLNQSFRMAGETGDIPVTYRTFHPVVLLPFAVGIVCQRTDEAHAAWQLKTHAAIVAGYQRQLAEYEDKLNRHVTAARARMAAAGGYAHNPDVVRDELRRAFIFLLLGEQPSALLPTPVPAPTPWDPALPDPVTVRDWGAMVAFFERAFEWENLMFTCYPYYWARKQRWSELVLVQDADPQFEEFLKAGAARVVLPVRPGFEAALAHFQETGDVWLGEEIPDMFGANYVSIIEEIKGANHAPGEEVVVDEWTVRLPTTLVQLRDDATLPSWPSTPEP